MSALAEFQRRFQAAILAGDTCGLAALAEKSRAASAGAGAGIYAGGYRERLYDVLALDFPCVAELLGADLFAHLCSDYIGAHPSRTYSLHAFGAGLAAFAGEHSAVAGSPWIAELANFEHLLGAAFDAPDAGSSGDCGAVLRAVPPADWGALTFAVDPSVHCCRFEWNVPALHAAVSGATELPLNRRERAQWVIWRRAFSVRYRLLADDNAAALALARAGTCFETICDSLGDHGSPALRAVELLHDWLGCGFITAIEAPASARRNSSRVRPPITVDGAARPVISRAIRAGTPFATAYAGENLSRQINEI